MKKKLKIAIIDSGVNAQVFKDLEIEQYYVKDVIVKEEPKDIIGHGTSVLDIMLREIKSDISILVLRPVIVDGQLKCQDLSKAIRFAVDQGASIINISMGTDELKNRGCIDDVCEYAFKKNTVVVCAFSKHDNIIMPWAAKYVLKVSQGSENSNRIRIKKGYFGSEEIVVEKVAFRTKNNDGKTKFTIGHSAATAYVTGKICMVALRKNYRGRDLIRYFLETNGLEYCEDIIFKSVNLIQGKIIELEAKKNILSGNAAVIPVSKEMDGLQLFSEYVGVNIIAGVDYAKKGRKETLIPIKTSLEELREFSIDWLIVGYLDKLEKMSEDWSLAHVLDFAIENKYNVFSFLPIEEYYKIKFANEGIILMDTPIYDDTYYKKIIQAVPYSVSSKLPVLGVFGTSSKQGKFTLQMLIRKELEKRKIEILTIGTEHQASIMNTSLCYPCGYGGKNNIRVSLEQSIEIIQKAILYLEYTTDVEMVLVGGQSWLIPYNIQKQVAINNLAFLEATRPDCAVVVVNPELDPERYIYDTIHCLQSIYKTRVIAIAFSDKKIYMKGNTILKQKRTVENIVQTSEWLRQKHNIFSGCIADSEFIKKVVDIYMEIVSE